MKRTKQDYLLTTFLLLLLTAGFLQFAQVTNDYSFTWLKRIWRSRSMPALERSAAFYLGDSGTKYMTFLEQMIPPDKNVILAERSAQFSNQSILQYFLTPRDVISCRCDQLGGACLECLANPENYLPVTRQFPPGDVSMDTVGEVKKFIPAPFESDYYLGIYVPSLEEQPIHQPEDQPKQNLLIILAGDLVILLCLGLLGAAYVRLIVPTLPLIETVTLAVPVGTGIQTWFMFLASWGRISLSPLSTAVIYLALWIPIFVILKISRAKLTFPRLSLPPLQRRLVHLVVWLLIGAAWVIMLVIAVGRAYSLYDDIAIWSLKGHAFAEAGSVFTERSGGHGLAYPLNIPLSVTIFKFFTGDHLPGSKFLFPLTLLALLIGVYQFARRRGTPPILAAGGIFFLLTVPSFFFYATTGFANVPFTAYLILGILHSYEGLEQNDPRRLGLAGLLLGLAGWTRPEGLPYALALLSVLLFGRWITRQPWRSSAAWLAPAVLLPGIWLIFAFEHIRNDQAGGAFSALFHQVVNGQIDLTPLRTMFDFISQRLINHEWRYFSILAVIVTAAGLIRTSFKKSAVLSIFLLLAAAAFFFVVGIFFIESANEPDFQLFLEVSFDRAFFPTVVLLVLAGLLAFRKIPGDAERLPGNLAASSAEGRR